MRDFLDKILNPRTLRILIGLKLVFLVTLWVALDKRWTVGDQRLRAEEAAAKKDETPPADKKAEDGKDKPAEAATADGEQASATPAPEARRSFLDNLLNLPALDKENLKKDEVGRYLALAEKKQRQVEERIAVLKTKEAQLVALEKSIDVKAARLDEERRYFADTIQKEKELKGERLERLIEVYKKMEPKKAAPVIEKLDKDLVVQLFKAFPQKQVTSVLTLMQPAKSVELTEYYGRVRSMREYDLLKEMNSSLRQEFQDCKGMPKE